MKPLLLLLLLALPFRLFAFGDWETTSISITSSPIVLNPDFQSSHHSHAVGNGTIYFAYVIRANEMDTLYLVRKNLYATSSGITPSTQPIIIDQGQRITSVQVRHCPVLGTTHFVYSKFYIAANTDIGAYHVTHTIYRRGENPATTRQDLASVLAGHFETSLKIHYPRTSRYPVIGLAYYAPNSNGTGTLSYADLQEDGSWSITNLAPQNSTIGKGCDLNFDSNGNVGIVYQGPLEKQLSYTSRPASGGLWISSPAITPSGEKTASQPSLFHTGNTRHIAYVEKDGLTRRLRFSSMGTGPLGTNIVVDTITNPPLTIFPFSFSRVKLAISEGRVVISYNRSRTLTTTEPWIAVRHLGDFSFENLQPPFLTNDDGSAGGATAISLESNNYPIITWISGDDRGLRACFCPDFTDRDKDSVIHLHEKAFKMNPNVPDIKNYPFARIRKGVSGEDPTDGFLSLNFLISGQGSINTTTQVIETDDFLYRPELSVNLRFWERDAELFASGVLNLPQPMFNSSGFVRLTSPLGNLDDPKGFLRLEIFRK